MEESPQLWGNSIYCIENKDSMFLFCFLRDEYKLITYTRKGDCFQKKSEHSVENKYNCLYVKNIDTILLFHNRTGNFAILNSNQQITDTFTIPLLLDSIQYMISSSAANDIVFREDKIVLGILPYTSLEMFYSCQYELIYNLKNRTVEAQYLKFPSGYGTKSWWGGIGNSYKKCSNHDGDIIYSFPMENKLYKYSQQKISEIKVDKSNYFSAFPPPAMNLLEDYSPRFVSIYADTIPYYHSLLFDPYRNIYLRVAAHSQYPNYVDSVTNTLKKNLFFDREWSIMIFDTNFKLIGEQKFEKKIYFYNILFVTRNGILIALGDGLSKKENLLEFHLFKFKDL